MTVIDMAAMLLTGTGVLFFIAGTVGMLRFPDVYSRLHALTKADNTGLGFIVAGLALEATAESVLLKLLLIWILIIFSSATSCYLIAQAAHRMNIAPWRKP